MRVVLLGFRGTSAIVAALVLATPACGKLLDVDVAAPEAADGSIADATTGGESGRRDEGDARRPSDGGGLEGREGGDAIPDALDRDGPEPARDADDGAATEDTGATYAPEGGDAAPEASTDGGSECHIGGVVYANGAGNPVSACQACDPTQSSTAWSDVTEGTTCGSGVICCGSSCVEIGVDVNHCGGCGHACSDGPMPSCSEWACNYGRSPRGRSPRTSPSTSTSVYWTGAGALMKVAISGGAPSAVGSDEDVTRNVVSDATGVYWAGFSTVQELPAGASSPVTLVSGLDNGFGIASNGTSVYWSEIADVSSDAGDGTVKMQPVSGGTTTTIAGASRYRMALPSMLQASTGPRSLPAW